MWLRSGLVTLLAIVALTVAAAPVAACPFCAAVGLTLGDEIDAAAVAVIAQHRSAGSDDPNLTDPDAAKAEFAIVRVLKGRDVLGNQRTFRTLYFADVPPGTKFLVLGNGAPDLKWATPVSLTPRGWEYLSTMLDLPPKGPQRLRVALQHLEDSEEMLRRDSYDEFARVPFDVIKELAPHLNPDDLVKRISLPIVPVDSSNGQGNRAQIVRLYCTLLGVCGKPEHGDALAAIMRGNKPEYTPALDAMIAAYLRLKGPEGLPLVEQLYLTSEKAQDSPKANAAINALRFHGQEPDVIPQKQVIELMRSLLARPQLAARVLADLARWAEKPEDWRDVDRAAELFEQAKGDTLWVRDPAVGYLAACPLPEAKKQLERLAKIDPASVKRGSSFGLPQDSTVYLGSGPATPAKAPPGGGKTTAGAGKSSAGPPPAGVSVGNSAATGAGMPTGETGPPTAPSGISSPSGLLLPVAGGALLVVLLVLTLMRLRGGAGRV